VLMFHGHPGSRLFTFPATVIPARVLMLERPGYGLSTFKPNRSLLDWADDVREFADALKLERFAVAGYSGGGPHALACAYKLGARITAAASVSGCAPYEIPGVTHNVNAFNQRMYTWSARAPALSMALFKPLGWITRNNVKPFLEGFVAPMPASDREMAAQPGMSNMLETHVREAFRQGANGFAWEASILGRPWDFKPEDIRVPVQIWQGKEDRNVSVEMGQYLARTIPQARAHFFAGEGHLVTLFKHWNEILKALLESSKGATS
jgi:pimeloyl-ACP methyl ester carboxylesterase